jgi:hypothetical protein
LLHRPPMTVYHLYCHSPSSCSSTSVPTPAQVPLVSVGRRVQEASCMLMRRDGRAARVCRLEIPFPPTSCRLRRGRVVAAHRCRCAHFGDASLPLFPSPSHAAVRASRPSGFNSKHHTRWLKSMVRAPGAAARTVQFPAAPPCNGLRRRLLPSPTPPRPSPSPICPLSCSSSGCGGRRGRPLLPRIPAGLQPGPPHRLRLHPAGCVAGGVTCTRRAPHVLSPELRGVYRHQARHLLRCVKCCACMHA